MVTAWRGKHQHGPQSCRGAGRRGIGPWWYAARAGGRRPCGARRRSAAEDAVLDEDDHEPGDLDGDKDGEPALATRADRCPVVTDAAADGQEREDLARIR